MRVQVRVQVWPIPEPVPEPGESALEPTLEPIQYGFQCGFRCRFGCGFRRFTRFGDRFRDRFGLSGSGNRDGVIWRSSVHLDHFFPRMPFFLFHFTSLLDPSQYVGFGLKSKGGGITGMGDSSEVDSKVKKFTLCHDSGAGELCGKGKHCRVIVVRGICLNLSKWNRWHILILRP